MGRVWYTSLDTGLKTRQTRLETEERNDSKVRSPDITQTHPHYTSTEVTTAHGAILEQCLLQHQLVGWQLLPTFVVSLLGYTETIVWGAI